tara:strand:+ start:119 stop:325 length:207 start_codon:yes stop_codon:yes gene_type:complete
MIEHWTTAFVIIESRAVQAKLNHFLEHFTYRELINTRGTTWCKLPDTIKNTLDRDRAIELMSEQGKHR